MHASSSMMCGSAFKNKGVQACWMQYGILPSPLDMEHVEGTILIRRKKSRQASIDEPFAALAFKIATDPFVGRFAF